MSKIKSKNDLDGNYQVLEIIDYIAEKSYEKRTIHYDSMKCNNSRPANKEKKDSDENYIQIKYDDYKELMTYKKYLSDLFRVSIKKNPIKKMFAYRNLAKIFRKFYSKNDKFSGDIDD